MTDRSEMPSRKTPVPQFTYLGEMTDEDYALGFRYQKIASPTAQLPSRRVVAAVYEIDKSHRIVRVHDPTFNRPGYVHQCFGVCRRLKSPGWFAVQLTYPDSKMAIRSWELGKDNAPLGDPLFPYIEERAPTADEY